MAVVVSVADCAEHGPGVFKVQGPDGWSCSACGSPLDRQEIADPGPRLVKLPPPPELPAPGIPLALDHPPLPLPDEPDGIPADELTPAPDSSPADEDVASGEDAAEPPDGIPADELDPAPAADSDDPLDVAPPPDAA